MSSPEDVDEVPIYISPPGYPARQQYPICPSCRAGNDPTSAFCPCIWSRLSIATNSPATRRLLELRRHEPRRQHALYFVRCKTAGGDRALMFEL